jgi:DNA repair protein SbcD/Mre11
MQELNFESFKLAIDKCLESNLDFALFAGDLFDTAYPGIDVLKETFGQFKRLKEAKIPCFIIAGSHDYSVSGKTFLDVLEKAGFCKNAEKFEIKDDKIILEPLIHEGVAIYGYPGKKSGLEIPDLRKIKFNEAPGMFKIFMLHTTLDKAKGTLPIDAIETDLLPHADYYAAGHLHIDFQYENFVYPGPIFPNSFKELEDLEHGSFYIVDTNKDNPLEKVELKIKKVCQISVKISDALVSTDYIISELSKKDLKDKIILLRVSGELENGKQSDIKFKKIEEFVEKQGAYFLLKNTHELKVRETEINKELETKDAEEIEEEAVHIYSQENPSDFNSFIPQLMEALSIEKQEGEKTDGFENRLFEETKKVFKLDEN